MIDSTNEPPLRMRGAAAVFLKAAQQSCALLFLLLPVGALAQPPQTATRAPAAATAGLPSGCPAPGEGRGPGRPGAPMGAGRTAGPPPPGYGEEVAGPPRKRLLIWADTRNGIGQHDIAHAMAVIEELGYKSGLYNTYIRTDSAIIAKRPKMTTGEPASGGPSLCNVDAIFFLGHREIDMDASQRADLLWFVHDAGKGFVAAHSGTTAFFSWPEFGDLIGGRFDNHPWGIVQAPVIVEDPSFPGMKQFGPSFTIKEEFYQTKDFSLEKSRILMRLDTSKLDMNRPGVESKDAPYPLTWAKMYGKGRVFYSALGHAPSTWDDPKIQEMYLGAIKWALGLVDADVTPQPLAASTKP